MKIKDLNGKIHTLNLSGYSVNQNDTRPRSEVHLRCRALLKKLFPLDQILEEVYISCENLYLDFLIPSRKLVVEPGGRQHKEFVPFFHKTKPKFFKAQSRDRRKAEFCKLNGIKLVELPDNEDEQEWIKKII